MYQRSSDSFINNFTPALFAQSSGDCWMASSPDDAAPESKDLRTEEFLLCKLMFLCQRWHCKPPYPGDTCAASA